jgi:hypothetical protein
MSSFTTFVANSFPNQTELFKFIDHMINSDLHSKIENDNQIKTREYCFSTIVQQTKNTIEKQTVHTININNKKVIQLIYNIIKSEQDVVHIIRLNEDIKSSTVYKTFENILEFPNVLVYYIHEGATPNTLIKKYSNKIIINQTSKVKPYLQSLNDIYQTIFDDINSISSEQPEENYYVCVYTESKNYTYIHANEETLGGKREILFTENLNKFDCYGKNLHFIENIEIEDIKKTHSFTNTNVVKTDIPFSFKIDLIQNEQCIDMLYINDIGFYNSQGISLNDLIQYELVLETKDGLEFTIDEKYLENLFLYNGNIAHIYMKPLIIEVYRIGIDQNCRSISYDLIIKRFENPQNRRNLLNRFFKIYNRILHQGHVIYNLNEFGDVINGKNIISQQLEHDLKRYNKKDAEKNKINIENILRNDGNSKEVSLDTLEKVSNSQICSIINNYKTEMEFIKKEDDKTMHGDRWTTRNESVHSDFANINCIFIYANTNKKEDVANTFTHLVITPNAFTEKGYENSYDFDFMINQPNVEMIEMDGQYVFKIPFDFNNWFCKGTTYGLLTQYSKIDYELYENKRVDNHHFINRVIINERMYQVLDNSIRLGIAHLNNVELGTNMCYINKSDYNSFYPKTDRISIQFEHSKNMNYYGVMIHYPNLKKIIDKVILILDDIQYSVSHLIDDGLEFKFISDNLLFYSFERNKTFDKIISLDKFESLDDESFYQYEKLELIVECKEYVDLDKSDIRIYRIMSNEINYSGMCIRYKYSF